MQCLYNSKSLVKQTSMKVHISMSQYRCFFMFLKNKHIPPTKEVLTSVKLKIMKIFENWHLIVKFTIRNTLIKFTVL